MFSNTYFIFVTLGEGETIMENNNHEHSHTHSELKHSHTHEHEHDTQAGHEHDHVHPTNTHTHKHTHEEGKVDQHTHDHHDHQHTHESGKDELNMLSILLDHWVHHNEDHAKDFSEWSKKAVTMGKPETAEAIMDAVDYIKNANKSLVIAKENMK